MPATGERIDALAALSTYRALATRDSQAMRLYSTDPMTQAFLQALISRQATQAGEQTASSI
ncbi:hypothetical protein [Streptomyces sp. NPDC001422]|uniref:hypothetical protein n=1 Tax=Streptomyces sp. NPDC001422 TaxID=3364575 RepID=UPI003676E275